MCIVAMVNCNSVCRGNQSPRQLWCTCYIVLTSHFFFIFQVPRYWRVSPHRFSPLAILFSRIIKIVASMHSCDDSLLKRRAQSGEVILRKKKGFSPENLGRLLVRQLGSDEKRTHCWFTSVPCQTLPTRKYNSTFSQNFPGMLSTFNFINLC
jgi:hypothetical protein